MFDLDNSATAPQLLAIQRLSERLDRVSEGTYASMEHKDMTRTEASNRIEKLMAKLKGKHGRTA
jgi:hypothetical protein